MSTSKRPTLDECRLCRIYNMLSEVEFSLRKRTTGANIHLVNNLRLYAVAVERAVVAMSTNCLKHSKVCPMPLCDDCRKKTRASAKKFRITAD